MSLDILLPVMSRVVGRDLVEDYRLFTRASGAVDKSLSPHGREFFKQNWKTIIDFMETEDGRAAIVMFLELWAEHLTPKSIANTEVKENDTENKESSGGQTNEVPA